MNNVIEKITTAQRWQIVLFVYVVTLAITTIYMNYTGPLEDFANGAVHLDIRIGSYGREEAIEYLTILGEQGRAFYVRTTLFDTVWPLCIAISGILIAPWAFERKRLIVAAAFFPAAFGILDFFENIGLLMMINAFPDISPGLAMYSATFTFVKQLMIPGATLCFLALPFVALYRGVKNRRLLS